MPHLFLKTGNRSAEGPWYQWPPNVRLFIKDNVHCINHLWIFKTWKWVHIRVKQPRFMNNKAVWLHVSFTNATCTFPSLLQKIAWGPYKTSILALRIRDLLDEFLGLEESAEVEHLPCGQTQQTTHGEDAEVEDAGVGRFWKRKWIRWKESDIIQQ